MLFWKCSSSTRRVAPIAASWVCGLALSPSHAGADSAAGARHEATGAEHYYNHEYPLAVDSFRRFLALEPENPTAYVRLAQAQLYLELDRLRLLDTSAFHGDEVFYTNEKPKPDRQAAARILSTLREGKRLCDRLLRSDQNDPGALHGLAQLLALRANYEFMISKAYFAALSSGRRAKSLSYRLATAHPDFVDGLLVAGLHEYIVGSLPWLVRILVAMSGYRGHKRKGVELITRVARDGHENRDDARVLLALLYRREKQYRKAAELFQALRVDFPRNYLFQLEAAAMYEHAGERRVALGILRDAYRKYSRQEQRFERMPERVVKALERCIGRFEEELGGSPAPERG